LRGNAIAQEGQMQSPWVFRKELAIMHSYCNNYFILNF
jgi:hypothetical protein